MRDSLNEFQPSAVMGLKIYLSAVRKDVFLLSTIKMQMNINI